jgi:glutamate-1-semialdehyde 2,1-aminomutase
MDIRTTEGWSLYERAKKIIPGGTQLLSKRPELFAPELWPPYAKEATGCTIVDIDDNRFIDMTTMGIGTCLLGYADPVVNEAVSEAVRLGSMCSLNFPEEVELAELLLEFNPWARMVRFARTGGEALAVAVRIARASSGKTGIAFCGYHGWHDWYLAANLSVGNNLDGHLLPGLEPKGVPEELAGTIFPFHYNDISEFDDIAARHGDSLGVIVMEPIRYSGPKDGFLEEIRKRADKLGAVLIFDEVTSGWRHTLGGAHRLFGVTPDIAVYAKALGNGYPCAAVVGLQETMESAQSTFISSSYWTERIGPAAACATLKEFRRRNVPALLRRAGEQVQSIWKKGAADAGIPIKIEGLPALCHFTFDVPDSEVLNTLLVQQMLEAGYLANNSFYASCAHEEAIVSSYGEALNMVFHKLKKEIDSGNLPGALRGPVAQKGFTRLT